MYARLERVDDQRVEGNYPSGIQSTDALDGDIDVITGFECLIEGQSLRCGWLVLVAIPEHHLTKTHSAGRDAAVTIDCRDTLVGFIIQSANDIIASLNALNGVGIVLRHDC